jgi:hypothetical protein
MNSLNQNVIVPNTNIIHGASLSRIDKSFIIGSKRSWWQVRYASGKVLNEWQTKQFTSFFFPTRTQAHTTRWEEISKVGIRGLYLLCPNGHAGALESDGDYQYFQLKSGVLAMSQEQTSHSLDYHIIGKVDDSNGNCTCWVWDYKNASLSKFKDNVTHMAFNGIGPISLGEAVGVK